MGDVAPRVLIAGGSLGGLTAALTLRDAGCDVHVYERSRAPLEGRGAGIVLHPASIRYFIESGAMDVGRVSSKADWLRYLDRGGNTIHEAPCRYWFTSYYTLHKGLLDCFDESRYHLGAGMTGLHQQDDSISLELSAGGEVAGDLLVCADGIHSTARRLLLPDVLPRYAGYVGWRGTVREDELTARTLGLLRDACTYFVGDSMHILTYPIPDFDGSVEPGNRRVNFVWYRNVNEGPALDDLMTDVHGVRQEISLAPGAVRQEHIDALLAATEQLPESIAEVVGKSREPFVQAVFDIAVPRMAFGRACLIGDAAFSIRPHAAAGTAKAAEDGWQLAAAMRAEHGDVVAALKRWEPNQLALGHSVMDRSREIGRRAQVSGTYVPGDPSVAFGLYEPEDSWITDEGKPHRLASSAERPKM
jgi:2,6-dihydroxypyridine 3-monooxygenase